MSLLHCRAFDVLFAAWTALYLPAIGVLLVLGKPPAAIRAVSRVWASRLLTILRWTMGITHVELGGANIPAGPYLVVANHRLQWKTIALVVGAYPPGCRFDVRREAPDAAARARMAALAVPTREPIGGGKGPIMRTWPRL